MSLRLIQIATTEGRCVAALQAGTTAVRLAGVASVYELATTAIQDGLSLQRAVEARLTDERIDLTNPDEGGRGGDELRLLPPIDHPDPAHLYLTGTGLTHLGSAEGRDKMHTQTADTGSQTDSMRMFLMGLRGGKPAYGVGVQPEWFYKGDGSSVVGAGATLQSPTFALDGGEEPEIAGIYLIDPQGNPCRLGYCLVNEFSDHVTERENYLWLAHSKLRQVALGPEMLNGPLPNDIKGVSRILRGGQVVWQRPFLTGEANMSHAISNLEYHHFKYPMFRRPGDVHVHFFGTATLSFADGFRTQEGDVFDIQAEGFVLPLRNRLADAKPSAFNLRAL